MEALILELVAKAPWLAGVFMVMGVLRMIMKPLMSFLRTFVMATPSDMDDKILDEVENSKIYAAIAYVLDWLFSLKIIK